MWRYGVLGFGFIVGLALGILLVTCFDFQIALSWKVLMVLACSSIAVSIAGKCVDLW
ncbi:MAG: hypothetical protein Q8P20_08445 [bacterium]|nr:hypothetical protein [bacterium]